MQITFIYIILCLVFVLSIFTFVSGKSDIKRVNGVFLSIAATLILIDQFQEDERLFKLQVLLISFVLLHFFLSRTEFFKKLHFGFIGVALTSLFFLLIGPDVFHYNDFDISFNSWNVWILPFIGAGIWYACDFVATLFSQFVGFETRNSLEQVNLLFFFALSLFIGSFLAASFGVYVIGISALASSFYRKEETSNIAFSFLLISTLPFFSKMIGMQSVDLLVAKNVEGLCLGIAGVWFLQILSKSKANAFIFSLIGFFLHLILSILLILAFTQKAGFGGVDAYMAFIIGTAIGFVSFYDFALTHVVFSSSLLIGMAFGPMIINKELIEQKEVILQNSNAKSNVKSLPLEDIVGSYKIDPYKSSVLFKLGNTGDITEGCITSLSGYIVINKDIAMSSFNVVIPVDSLTTFNSMRDESLMEKNYFFRAKFPKMRYLVRSIKKEMDYYLLNGNFTMIGVSKPLPVQMKFIETKTTDGIQRHILVGKAKIDRTKFGMTPDSKEGNIVDFEFRVEITEI